jgi:hypothetical protein
MRVKKSTHILSETLFGHHCTMDSILMPICNKFNMYYTLQLCIVNFIILDPPEILCYNLINTQNNFMKNPMMAKISNH